MNILIELQLETFKSDRTSQVTSSNSMRLGINVPAQAGQNLLVGHSCQNVDDISAWWDFLHFAIMLEWIIRNSCTNPEKLDRSILSLLHSHPLPCLEVAKGRVRLPKQMNFRKTSKEGGRGHFQSKNLCCRFFTFMYGFFRTFFEKNCNTIFQKWGGRGQRLFGIFPKIHLFW